MKNINILIKVIVCSFILSSLLSSCITEPNYPNEPSIGFEGVSHKYYDNIKTDSINIVISFKDGDGNLGIDGFERDTLSNGTPIPVGFKNNFFVDIKKKQGNSYVDVVFPGGVKYSGRFPYLNSTGKDTPLEGNISYDLQLLMIPGSPVLPGDEIIFEVQIADRSFNLSNKITTSPIVLGTDE